jgi:hypothetical protein
VDSIANAFPPMPGLTSKTTTRVSSLQVDNQGVNG